MVGVLILMIVAIIHVAKMVNVLLEPMHIAVTVTMAMSSYIGHAMTLMIV